MMAMAGWGCTAGKEGMHAFIRFRLPATCTAIPVGPPAADCPYRYLRLCFVKKQGMRLPKDNRRWGWQS